MNLLRLPMILTFLIPISIRNPLPFHIECSDVTQPMGSVHVVLHHQQVVIHYHLVPATMKKVVVFQLWKLHERFS
jgi:hypothetical protein